MEKYLLILLLSLLSFPQSGYSQQNDDAIKVLFIGNSFTYMNDMSSMFEKMAKKSGKEVIVESNTKGGANFKEHTGRKDMYEAISKRQWDYIILQGYSRELSFPVEYMDTATFPYVDQILEAIYENNTCTNVMFYMTWGYEEGYPSREEIKTFEMMADTIRNGYKAMGELYNLPVVPVGMVWKQLRLDKGYNFYINDKFHPNTNGSFLVASSFYSAIFNEQNKEYRPFGVSRRIAKNITKTAFEYVSENAEEYRLDHNYMFVQFDERKKKNSTVTYDAGFEDASRYIWKFGDGDSTLNQSGVHKFDLPGEYKITLEVESDCGMRQYHQTVHVQSIERARRTRRRDEKED